MASGSKDEKETIGSDNIEIIGGGEDNLYESGRCGFQLKKAGLANTVDG